MKGLLISPPVGNPFMSFPPIGIMSLYGMVDGEHDVRIADLTYATRSEISCLLSERFDFVGISCAYTANLENVLRLASEVKRRSPRTVVITGGIHATFDYVVMNEGELTFYELIRHLERGGDDGIENIDGIAYKGGKGVVLNRERELFDNLDDLPLLRPDMLNNFHYKGAFGSRMWLMETSRGCIYNCKYCSPVNMWRKKWRTKSVERVIEEYGLLNREGIDFIFPAEDFFCVDKGRVVEICEGLIRIKNRIRWCAHAQPDFIIGGADTIELMKRAGCELLQLELISTSERILREYRRPYTVESWIRACEELKGTGMPFITNILIGCPGETIEEMNRSIRFAMKSGGIISVNVLEPRPGTEYYDPHKFGGIFHLFGRGRCMLHEKRRRVELIQRMALPRFYLRPGNIRKMISYKTNTMGRYLLMNFELYFGALKQKTTESLRRWLRRILKAGDHA